MSYPIHDENKQRLEALQDRFDDLLDAADALREWLSEKIEAEKTAEPPRQPLIGRLTRQLHELSDFSACLEGPAAEALLRMHDRLILIQLIEKDEYV
ncbi:MAG: hypothetical protein O2807_09810 [bacterium]|nr:hypothetical protein [bacterium]